MTASNKKWATLVIVLLVLGAGAGIFMQQTATRVEAEVRAALTAVPGVVKHNVDSVQYGFLSQSLTLKKLQLNIQDKTSDIDIDIAVDELVVVKPNLKALQGEPDAGTLLADEVRATGYAATMKSPVMTGQKSVATIRIVQPQGDIPGLMQLTLVNGKPRDAAKGLKALYTFKVASLHYAGISADMTMPEFPPLHMRMDSVEGRDISFTYISDFVFKNWEIQVEGKGGVTVGALELAACSPPDLSKLPPELLNSEAQDIDPKEAEQILTSLMPKGKPLIGTLALRDVRESLTGGNISLKNVVLKDFGYDPPQIGFQIEELNIPASLLRLPVVSMLGYSRLTLSGNSALRPLKDKQVRLESNLDVQDAGRVQLTMNMENPLPVGTDYLENMDKLLLENGTLTYTDNGLAGRGVQLTQRAMNMGPDVIVEMVRANAVQLIGNNPENIKQIMNFVEKPGEITFSTHPAKPVPLKQLHVLMTPGALHITSVPGPKTLQELAKP